MIQLHVENNGKAAQVSLHMEGREEELFAESICGIMKMCKMTAEALGAEVGATWETIKLGMEYAMRLEKKKRPRQGERAARRHTMKRGERNGTDL